jgi:4-diphosphocytidyl-2-C-methyl-D-erythritol kinase
VLTPVLARGTFHWVLALAETGLSTPEVYAELDRQRGETAFATPPAKVLAALRLGDAKALGEALHNDMEPAALALRPSLQATLDAGRELGALGAMVSGSGPTCAFLARSKAAAIRIGAALTAEAVCKTIRVAEGPVAGARVV